MQLPRVTAAVSAADPCWSWPLMQDHRCGRMVVEVPSDAGWCPIRQLPDETQILLILLILSPLTIHASSARPRFNARDPTSNSHRSRESILRHRSFRQKPEKKSPELRFISSSLGDSSGDEAGAKRTLNLKRPNRSAAIAAGRINKGLHRSRRCGFDVVTIQRA